MLLLFLIFTRVRSLGNPCSAGLLSLLAPLLEPPTRPPGPFGGLPPDRVSSGMVGAFALPPGSTLCNWLAESATPVLDVPPGTTGREWNPVNFLRFQLVGWRRPHVQHDAAEFIQFLMPRLGWLGDGFSWALAYKLKARLKSSFIVAT